MTKKPLCIDSKLVYRIDRVSSDGVHEAFSCNANRKVEYDEKLASLIREVMMQTQYLQTLFSRDFLPIRVTILEGMQDIVRVQYDEIFLSQDQLENKTQLERNLIKIWLRQNLKIIELQKSFLEETLVDFIQDTNGTAKERIKILHAAWPMNMLSAGGHNLAESLQNFVSSLLLESYLELKLSERQVFLTYFVAYLKKHSVSQDLRALATNIETVEQATEQLKIAANFFSLMPMIGTHFQEKISDQKIFQSEQLQVNDLQFDYLFEVGESKLVNREEVQKLSESQKITRTHGQSMAFVNHGEVWILGQQYMIPLKSIGRLKAHQYILIDCEMPDYLKIQKLSFTASKLLFVNRCHDLQKLQFDRFLKEGIDGFAKENLSISFMQIHLASLRQIWTDRQINPLSQLASGKYQSEFFKKTGWQKPIWDDALQAYRSKSVIQSIDLFRN